MKWIERMKKDMVEKEVKASTTTMIKVPEPFKKDTKWHPWKESVITYLNANSFMKTCFCTIDLHT
jgi:hypothetical protein